MKTKSPIKHSPMDQFKHQNGELLVNGNKLSLLKFRAGQTPFYAYDRSIIKNRICQFKQSMPAALKLHYAIKANPMPALVDFIANLVDGLDVASGMELNIALNSGINSKNISFAGPGKRQNELKMAIACGTLINVESINEIEQIKTICEQIGLNANIAVRVNPNFELKSSGMKMAGGPQQFGIDSETVPQVLDKIDKYGLKYKGLHIFTGSQNLNAESVSKTQENIFQLATNLQRNSPLEIKKLNIGGGLGIPYFPGEKVFTLDPIAGPLDKLMGEFCSEFGDVDIAMELGRFLVGEAGIYVAEIIDIKISRGTTFAIINGGLHHHLAASGNFGQVIRKNYPVAIGNKMDHVNNLPIQIVGPLCTPLDLIANKYDLPEPEKGDMVVVYQSGAYGYSASPRDFLSHPQPIEMLV